MAMNVNLTLLVQMIHFMVAYTIISRFLLRPGYEAVKVDEERLHQLRSLIIDQQNKLAEKHDVKRKNWQNCQEYFSHQRPVLEKEDVRVSSFKVVEQPISLTDEELEKLSTEVSSGLKAKVFHG